MFGKKHPVYMIGVVAELLQVHPQTLRIYEREGLVVPNRSKGNTRLYSQEDVEHLKLVIRLTRDYGVNLAGVEMILGLMTRAGFFRSEEVHDLEKMLQDMMDTRPGMGEAIHPKKKGSRRVIPIK